MTSYLSVANINIIMKFLIGHKAIYSRGLKFYKLFMKAFTAIIWIFEVNTTLGAPCIVFVAVNKPVPSSLLLLVI